jgi:branched-chain amino acid transport system ATP-binding protein
MLEVERLEAGYGQSQVLFGLSLCVDAGEVVTLMGRNGMGKTATVHAIMGLVSPWSGCIRFNGQDLRGLPPYRIARLGLGLVPEGRQIFPNLSVHENLVATAVPRSYGGASWTLERIYQLFPRLRDRARASGHQLSGGEQQMLAIGRALLTNLHLLILDEATEGLAPLLRQDIWRCLRLVQQAGQAILVIDKHVQALTALADRHYIIEKGRVVWTGSSAALQAQPEVQHRYRGVGPEG